MTHEYYALETWGGGRYTVIASYSNEQEAKKDRDHTLMLGDWSGMPPRVVKLALCQPGYLAIVK